MELLGFTFSVTICQFSLMSLLSVGMNTYDLLMQFKDLTREKNKMNKGMVVAQRSHLLLKKSPITTILAPPKGMILRVFLSCYTISWCMSNSPWAKLSTDHLLLIPGAPFAGRP